MHNIVDWINTNLLKLNVKKCKIVSYGRNVQPHDYEMENKILDKLDEIKDLGVTFDTGLKFDNHIQDKIKKANSMLGIIKRNFKKMPVYANVMLYKGLVRSHLEYAGSVWSPHLKKYIEQIERVQMRATKAFCKNKDMSYEERLRDLKLPTLRFRRTRGDMIEVFKVAHNLYDKRTAVTLNFYDSARTRGHQYRLFPQHVHYDLRKYFFSNRVISAWNSLPEFVVSAGTVNSFKNRLDSFWHDQDARFNWHMEVTGTGSRSKI